MSLRSIKIIVFTGISLFISCITISLDDIEISEANSTTLNELFLCENDTAKFYRLNSIEVILSQDTIPNIPNYRCILSSEARYLSTYLNEKYRVLCIENTKLSSAGQYYTFDSSGGGAISKAGDKTKYVYIPIRTISQNKDFNTTILIDTIYEEDFIYTTSSGSSVLYK